ncbi:hypothetical protein HID58_057840 [Brassica napus]|uniref:Uncharacterized protein n=1 Tax=Brassica napus TaxID=3708 RepID=A0ABQ7XHV8_BRANA|nr:hypothetical protein HID58_092695 [Brassica napus]KAH0854610.1 hypothetical protein HID58_057840 [Brassica napus]
MAEQNNSPTTRSRRQRFTEIDSSLGESYHFRPQIQFKSYDDRLQSSRLLFRNTVTPIGGYSRRHHNEDASIGYRYLCLRGFVVQDLPSISRYLLFLLGSTAEIGGW